MQIMSRGLKNAIQINITNILFSTAVKCTLIVAFLASLTINFWPFVWGLVSDKNQEVVVKSNTALDYIEVENTRIVKESKNEDIQIEFQENEYRITIKTNRGSEYRNVILNAVLQQNMNRYIETNAETLTQSDIEMLSNQNIKIESEVKNTKLEDSMYLFILATGVIVFLLMALLLIRIGAEVGNEKGSKVTEIILTSISKKQLYIAHVAGSLVTIVISFIIIFIPIVTASIINNPDITQDYSLIGKATLAKVFIHCIITSCSLMIMAISVCSFVKQTEDIGPLNLLVMAPMFVSYIYFGFTVNVYTGLFKVLTYVPIVSFYQNFCGVMMDEFSVWEFIIVECIGVIFIGVVYKLGYHVFSKNIAVDA